MYPVQPKAVLQDAIAGTDCSDVIATGNLLFVISNDGLAQYDLSTGAPVLMSTIQTEPVVYVVCR
jgi:hypothetical protein